MALSITAFTGSVMGFRPLLADEEIGCQSMRAPGLQYLLCIHRIRGNTWLAGILILFLFQNAYAGPDFPMFWNKFKSAVIAGDRTTIAEMTKFPLSMPYSVKAVQNKQEFLRHYKEIFKGEANAAQCFESAEPEKESAGRFSVYCPFKETPNDRENAPIRYIFELTNLGWKFAGLDNINE